MPMPKGMKIARGYATAVEDGGMNYRSIAERMTELGHPMNHASARNYVLRALQKFAVAMLQARGETVTQEKLENIIKDPSFQSGVSHILENIVG